MELATGVMPQERNSGSIDSRSAGNLQFGNANTPEDRTSGRVGAAEAQARVEAGRGVPKSASSISSPEREGERWRRMRRRRANRPQFAFLRSSGMPDIRLFKRILFDLRKMPKR